MNASHSVVDVPVPLAQISRMDVKALGSVLRKARKAKKLTLQEVATALGVTIAAVGNWERGENGPSMANLISLSRMFEFDPQEAAMGRYVPQENPGLLPPDALMALDVPADNFGPSDVQVLGVSVGGDDADFYLNGDVINYVRRPAGIRNARGVFALYVTGDSMSPRYEPGELIYCQRTTPVPGDHIVIEMYPDQSMDAGKCFIKKLVKRGNARLLCEQYNPRKLLEYDAGDVKAIYRVIPLRELVG